MRDLTILGIDPGIANTGLGVVESNRFGYSLIAAETIKTKACDETGKRLSIIQDEIHVTLDAWKIEAIAIERVFHNKNITSSLTTGAVLGLVHLIGHHHGLPIHEFTPQQVKKASGLGAKINKDTVKLVAAVCSGPR